MFMLMCGSLSAQSSTDPYRMVDPRIGTAHDGQTYPGVGVPFGMTTWTPETQRTEGKCIAPYYDKDPKITGFRGSHWLSGSCTQDYGSVTLLPTTGALKLAPAERASFYSHASERMSPASYSVFLQDYTTLCFSKITIHQPSGRTFKIEAYGNSPHNFFVQSASLNGRRLPSPSFDHQEIVKGGKLSLQMGPALSELAFETKREE